MKIVCIGAHPDDMEMGSAGTIAMHRKKGHDVDGILCTFGGVRGDPAEREQEALMASKVLGFRLNALDYPVAKLNKVNKEFVGILRKVLRDIGPDRIYTHTLQDYHQVHVTVAKSVLEAASSVRQIFSYEVISSTTTDFRPNAFADITEFIELKIRSLDAHKSQVADRTYLQHNVTKSLANTRYVWGKVGPNPQGFAEAFQIHRLML